MTHTKEATSILIICSFLLACVIFGALELSRIVSQQMCTKFQHNTGTPTRFVEENHFVWDCFVQQPDGTWTPNKIKG